MTVTSKSQYFWLRGFSFYVIWIHFPKISHSLLAKDGRCEDTNSNRKHLNSCEDISNYGKNLEEFSISHLNFEDKNTLEIRSHLSSKPLKCSRNSYWKSHKKILRNCSIRSWLLRGLDQIFFKGSNTSNFRIFAKKFALENYLKNTP